MTPPSRVTAPPPHMNGEGWFSSSMLPRLKLVELAHEGRGDGGVELAVEEHRAVGLGQERRQLLQVFERADGRRLEADRARNVARIIMERTCKGQRYSQAVEGMNGVNYKTVFICG